LFISVNQRRGGRKKKEKEESGGGGGWAAWAAACAHLLRSRRLEASTIVPMRCWSSMHLHINTNTRTETEQEKKVSKLATEEETGRRKGRGVAAVSRGQRYLYIAVDK